MNPTWPAGPRRNRARPPPRSGRVGSRTGGAGGRTGLPFRHACYRLPPASPCPARTHLTARGLVSVGQPLPVRCTAAPGRAPAGGWSMARTRAGYPISSETPGPAPVSSPPPSHLHAGTCWAGPARSAPPCPTLPPRRRPRPPPMPIRSTHSRWSRTRCRTRSSGAGRPRRARSRGAAARRRGAGPAAGGGGRRGGVQSATGLTGDGRLTW